MPKRRYTLSIASSFILYFYAILFVIWSGKKVHISLKKHFTINEKIHFLPYQWTNIRRIGRYFKIFFVKSLSLREITIIFGISASKYTENTRHHQKKFPTKFRPGVPQAKTEKENPLGGYRPNFVGNFF
jgi:hypothetical protein